MFFSFGCFVSLKCFLINVPHLVYLFYYYLFHFIIWAQGPFHFKSNLKPIGGLFFCRLLAHFRTKQVRPKAMTQQAAKPNGAGLNLHGLSPLQASALLQALRAPGYPLTNRPTGLSLLLQPRQPSILVGLSSPAQGTSSIGPIFHKAWLLSFPSHELQCPTSFMSNLHASWPSFPFFPANPPCKLVLSPPQVSCTRQLQQLNCMKPAHLLHVYVHDTCTVTYPLFGPPTDTTHCSNSPSPCRKGETVPPATHSLRRKLPLQKTSSTPAAPVCSVRPCRACLKPTDICYMSLHITVPIMHQFPMI